MSEPITKKDLFELRDGIREDIKVSTRDIIAHFNASQTIQNKRMDKIDTTLATMGDDLAKVKLAVVDLLGTEKHLHNLVEELQRNGIAIDRQRVFAR